jgi:hypothetical protein
MKLFAAILLRGGYHPACKKTWRRVVNKGKASHPVKTAADIIVAAEQFYRA